MEVLSHDNGLVISIGKDMDQIKKTTGGFKIKIADERGRAINELEIKKSTNPPADLSTYTIRSIDGKDYYFKLESVNEGSGGEEYTHSIWKPAKGGGILLEHYIQQEIKPDFDVDWEIIQSTQ